MVLFRPVNGCGGFTPARPTTLPVMEAGPCYAVALGIGTIQRRELKRAKVDVRLTRSRSECHTMRLGGYPARGKRLG